MNEVEELLKLEAKDLPAFKALVLDDLHQKVRKNLYLEVGTGPVLYLLSPSYSVLHPTANETINELVLIAFNEVSDCLPSGGRQQRKRYERITAVVARANQPKNLEVPIAELEFLDTLRQAPAGILHHLLIRDSRSIGFLFDSKHL